MRLEAPALTASLQRGLAATYLVFGDEPLQITEALDAIRRSAREQGYDERVVLVADPGFDWGALAAESQSLSLFSRRRLIELRLPSGKPGTKGSRALTAYAAQQPPDQCLLISTERLDQRAQNSAWVKALARTGTTVQARVVPPKALPGWVRGRARACGLELTGEAASLLAERVEGNLLACAQEIDRLRLLHGEGRLDAEQVLASVFDNARYNLFALADAALAGEAARTARVLRHLRAEGTAPPLIVWSLGRELRVLCEAASGVPLAIPMKREKMNSAHQGLLAQAVRRHPTGTLLGLLRHLGRVDRAIKGQERGLDPWLELNRIGLRLAGARV